MSLCCVVVQSLEAAGSRSAPVLEQRDGARVGLQLKICICACARGGRCPVSCWLTGTPPTVVPISGSQWNAGKQR